MTVPSAAHRPIPITDLGLEYEAIKKDLDPLLENILRSGSYVLGRELGFFETELAAYLGTRHAVGGNSGTDAVLLALRALNIQPGDEVKPIFVDIDPVSYAIDPSAAAAKITAHTKALIAVHLYGLPADVKALAALADARRVPLVEDMAQAIGSSYEGKKIGSWGTVACLSFYPTKNLGACGDAGAVITSSAAIAERVRALRNHGAKVKYLHEEVAYNSRLDEIQAAILRLKMRHLESWNQKRRALAAEYDLALAGLPITLPREVPGRIHVYHLYSIQSDKRDDLKAFLQREGISTGLHYPMPMHLLPALKSFGFHEGDFPVSERLARQTLSLPLYPFLDRADVRRAADAVRRFFQTRA